jgi:hypothetical protein
MVPTPAETVGKAKNLPREKNETAKMWSTQYAGSNSKIETVDFLLHVSSFRLLWKDLYGVFS